MLAGFSQGGAIALQTGLRHPDTLAGVMALSAYLPLAESLPQEATAANKETPIFMAHGLYDPVVPLTMGTGSMTFLVGLGYSIEWHQYPMPHSVCPQEIGDIGAWLRKILMRDVVKRDPCLLATHASSCHELSHHAARLFRKSPP